MMTFSRAPEQLAVGVLTIITMDSCEFATCVTRVFH